MITHNKGASWDYIQAPLKTSTGKSIQCQIDAQCSLHVEIYSSGGSHSPVYSSEHAVGIVIATGNLGQNLSANNIQKNLYISRDGGLTWKSTHSGNYVYDIGDHGALIVAASTDKATKEIEFTWDYGITWTKVNIADAAFHIKNIVTEPKSTSQQFLIYGKSVVNIDDEESQT